MGKSRNDVRKTMEEVMWVAFFINLNTTALE